MNPFHTFAVQLRAALRDGRIEFAVGGFDISLNEHEAGAFRAHWKPHAWLFISNHELVFHMRRFRSHFPRDKITVPSPTKTYIWNGDVSAIAYALKGNFQRRITLAPVTDFRGGIRRRNVRYRNLRPKQKVELLIAMNRMGLRGRVFLKGAKIAEVEGRMKIIKSQKIQQVGKGRH